MRVALPRDPDALRAGLAGSRASVFELLLDGLAKATPLRWQRFIAFARRWGAATGIGVALALNAEPACSEALGNVWGDPFFALVQNHPNCPAPAGPSYSREQAAQEAHARVERGTSCYLEGKCRLPNAYHYDAGIAADAALLVPRVADGRGASVWITVQRRWVYLDGCVVSTRQRDQFIEAVSGLPDVEHVLDRLMVRPR